MNMKEFFEGKKPPPIPRSQAQWLEAIHKSLEGIRNWMTFIGVVVLVLCLVGGCSCFDRAMSMPK